MTLCVDVCSNSNVFKSVEGKVGEAVSTVKVCSHFYFMLLFYVVK